MEGLVQCRGIGGIYSQISILDANNIIELENERKSSDQDLNDEKIIMAQEKIAARGFTLNVNTQ